MKIKRKSRTLEQRIRQGLIRELKSMEKDDVIGGWTADALVSWLMPPIRRILAREAKKHG